jgi:hypothetical protein
MSDEFLSGRVERGFRPEPGIKVQKTPQQPYDPSVVPPHPFWCDGCGHHASFSIRGCPIDHYDDCYRYGEDPLQVYQQAVRYCEVTGKVIP